MASLVRRLLLGYHNVPPLFSDQGKSDAPDGKERLLYSRERRRKARFKKGAISTCFAKRFSQGKGESDETLVSCFPFVWRVGPAVWTMDDRERKP
jgi:hypothetical protein